MFGLGCWLPMPCFQHAKPNGKRHPVDDAARFRHDELTLAGEANECSSAFRPAMHMLMLSENADKLGMTPEELKSHRVETGERTCPTHLGGFHYSNITSTWWQFTRASMAA